MVYGTSKTHGVFTETPVLTAMVDGLIYIPPAVSLSFVSLICANIFPHDFLSDWMKRNPV